MPGYGGRRTLVSVQTITETADNFGQMIKSWNTAATFRAKVRSPTGAEIWNAGQRKAVVTHVLECGRDAALIQAAGTLNPECRLLVGSAQYGIAWIDNVDQKNRELIIHCTEQVVPNP